MICFCEWSDQNSQCGSFRIAVSKKIVIWVVTATLRAEVLPKKIYLSKSRMQAIAQDWFEYIFERTGLTLESLMLTRAGWLSCLHWWLTRFTVFWANNASVHWKLTTDRMFCVQYLGNAFNMWLRHIAMNLGAAASPYPYFCFAPKSN